MKILCTIIATLIGVCAILSLECEPTKMMLTIALLTSLAGWTMLAVEMKK